MIQSYAHVVDLVIRAATHADVAAITQLYLEVAEEVVGREPTFRHVPATVDIELRYASRLQEADRVLLVGVADRRVVAFVDAALIRQSDASAYHAPGLDAYVEELIVTQSHRRRGVARRLMGAVEAWGRESGARIVTLDTHLTNAPARALYEGLGYRELGVTLVREL